MSIQTLESKPIGLNSAPRQAVLFEHPDLGRIFAPEIMTKRISTPSGIRNLYGPGEIGIVVAVQKRPVMRCGIPAQVHDKVIAENAKHGAWCIDRYELLFDSITHNERVDDGAAEQDDLLFGAGGTAFVAVAVASANLTKTKTDSSLGENAANGTTNEFTASGLSRAAGSLGTYTAPASLGATFSRVITKVFTATGSVTAHGSGLFNSTTVSGSILYVEDNFSSTAVLVNNDTLTVNWTITN